MVFWIILSIIAYSLLGTMICAKIGVLCDSDNFLGLDDFLALIVDTILIASWPLTLIFHFLLED